MKMVEGKLTVTGINEDVGPRSKKSKLLTLLGDVFEHTSGPNLTPQAAAKKEIR